jgi:SAM-dependent methyltransferase
MGNDGARITAQASNPGKLRTKRQGSEGMEAEGSFFHEEDMRYLRFLIPQDARILEIGSGIGDTLADLKPSYGLGIDLSPAMVDEAKRLPPFDFRVGDVEDRAFIASLPGSPPDPFGDFKQWLPEMRIVGNHDARGTRTLAI